ncbi:hypothetical protein SESBI_44466 [Sesbania bispinosa]|nr:hypothetical protein SESBI_44466 [Sesbania bispinosa]
MVALNQTMKKGAIYHQEVVKEQEDEAMDIFKMKGGMTNLKLNAIIAISLAISLGNVVVLSTTWMKRLILLMKKESQLYY